MHGGGVFNKTVHKISVVSWHPDTNTELNFAGRLNSSRLDFGSVFLTFDGVLSF